MGLIQSAGTSGTSGMAQQFQESFKKSEIAKTDYQGKLEIAKGVDIYKYVLLINVAALEGYVLQSRAQAEQSFKLSKAAAISGLTIVLLAIFLSVIFTLRGNENLNAAYLAGIVGVITEFISGVFFLLYSKTLSQINLFHDKLVDMQKTALTHIKEENEKPIQPIATR